MTGGLTQNDQVGNFGLENCSLSNPIFLIKKSVGAEAIIDAVVTNTPIFLRTSQASNGQLAGSLVLNNIKLNNVSTAVGVIGGAVVLNGGTTTIDTWAQGNVYTGTNPTGKFVQGSVPSPSKPGVLLDSAGRIFGKSHPQYENFATNQFVSIRSLGAVGDGTTDDTQAIKNALAQVGSTHDVLFIHTKH